MYLLNALKFANPNVTLTLGLIVELRPFLSYVYVKVSSNLFSL